MNDILEVIARLQNISTTTLLTTHFIELVEQMAQTRVRRVRMLGKPLPVENE
jgi:ABC-type ATPase involved in cell division